MADGYEDEEEVYESEDEYEEDEEDAEDYEYDEDAEEEDDEEHGEADRDVAQEWKGAQELPSATWQRLMSMVGTMKKNGHREMTVLVIGKPGSGRSSTVNSILCEAAASIRPIPAQTDTQPISIYVRTHGEFMIKLIDTGSIVTGPKINVSMIEEIARSVGSRRVNAVLYVDRLDLTRVEPFDKQIWKALRDHFGAALWDRTIICLTRGQMTMPSNYTFEQYLQRRKDQLTSAMRCTCGSARPIVIVENSNHRVAKNDDGERILPDGTVWLGNLMQALVDVTSKHSQGMTLRFSRYNPNRRRLWLIPVFLAAQWALKTFVFDRMIEEDGWRGDNNGEYDKDVREQMKLLAQSRKQQEQADEELRRRAREAAGGPSARLAPGSGRQSRVAYIDDDDDDDFDDEDDDY